ncbi:phosphotransferase family protein [Kitasatospora azatica]|uniref:phosphotransferase family protein n=1 Tax=Kitasatospora azatica TaxID=58347 RepID=UPI00056D61BA|nr:aminoglycoside phosphotransferase family protein [Kitasatospora azatica]
MQQHDDQWIAEFARLGHPSAEPLAAGMEGAVYRLGNGLVAKVWARRTEAELARLKEFYDGLADRGLTFATPRILRIHTTERGNCTVEAELQGRPLAEAAAVPAGGIPGPEVRDRVLDVLAELAAVSSPEQLGQLPVLDETDPFRRRDQGWTDSLSALIDRRVRQFAGPLCAVVPDLDHKVEQVRRLLKDWGPRPEGLVHGDLTPANILVDAELKPTAVLDFGFLSCPGDPAFDAAVTAGIADMYGPQARQIEERFDTDLAQRFGWPRELLQLYRIAYALITSNAYDPRGEDGHFAWCARILLREETAALLEGAAAAGP